MLVDLFYKVDFYFPYSGLFAYNIDNRGVYYLCLQAGLKGNLLLKKWTFVVKSGPFSIK